MSTQVLCSSCGALADAACDCHVPYLWRDGRAARAIPEHLKARLDAQDMTDLVLLGVRSVFAVLPDDLRRDQRAHAIQRIAEKLLRMG